MKTTLVDDEADGPWDYAIAAFIAALLLAMMAMVLLPLGKPSPTEKVGPTAPTTAKE